MNGAHLCEYIVLGYSASKAEEAKAPSLVVGRDLVDQKILIWIDFDWLQSLPEQERLEFNDLFIEWHGRLGEDIEDLFRQLPHWNLSPLRFLRSGRCTIAPSDLSFDGMNGVEVSSAPTLTAYFPS